MKPKVQNMSNGIQQKECAAGPNLYKIKFWPIACCNNKGLSLVESLTIIEEFQISLQYSYGEVGVAAKDKLKKVNSSTPDSEFMKLTKKKIFCGENAKDFQLDLSLSQISTFKYAPVISCDVEESFSMFKNVLSDKCMSPCEDNLEKLIVHCFRRK